MASVLHKGMKEYRENGQINAENFINSSHSFQRWNILSVIINENKTYANPPTKIQCISHKKCRVYDFTMQNFSTFEEPCYQSWLKWPCQLAPSYQSKQQHALWHTCQTAGQWSTWNMCCVPRIICNDHIHFVVLFGSLLSAESPISFKCR